MTKQTLNQSGQAQGQLTRLNTGKKGLLAKLNRYGKKLGLAGAIVYK
jgi:hypothetical protein